MISYHARRDDPTRHYLAVRLAFDRPTTAPVDLVLPSWVPGSYEIQDPARWLVDLTATAGPGGPPIAVTRPEKARWRLSEGSGPAEVRYRVYGHQIKNDTLDVADDHLFLNGPFSLVYLDGRRDEPCEISLDLPPGWEAVTELEELAGGGHRFRAAGYDELADSPIDCGHPRLFTVMPGGIRHRVSVCGSGGNFEPHRALPDLERIAAETMRCFGGPAVRSYTLFYHLSELDDGALEHANSFSYVCPRLLFRPASGYYRFVRVSAHEYVHAYLVKRIRPKAFVPIDYSREVYTNLLWLMEGTTDYVALLVLRRSGIDRPSKFLDTVAKDATLLLQQSGRHHQSLEEASRLAWIGYYRLQEENPNRSISYYQKGLLVSMLLDLDLRERSEGRRSLDDVLKLLWKEYGAVGRPIEEEEVPAIVERATGLSIDDFHRRYIAGTEELDLDRYARLAGLTFGPAPKKREPEDDEEPGDLGADWQILEGRVRLRYVRDGGPAQLAGLAPGDELVAYDGVRVAAADFDKLRSRFPAGTEATISFFRRGYLTTRTLTFGAPPPEKYRFEPLAEATAPQKAFYESWLGAPWTPPSRPEKS